MKATDYGSAGGWPGETGAGQPALTEKQAVTGILILIAVISSLFMLFILAFMLRSQLGDWEHLSASWMPLSDPGLLYANTFLLACGSISFAWAQFAARQFNLSATIRALILAGLFTGGFLIGQLWLWQQLVTLGYYINSNPANSFFYLLTGLHGLHLLGGMVAWILTLRLAWQGVEPGHLSLRIQVCAIYWHYLLLLWLVLLALLTSSPEAYAAFARWCGF